MVWAIIANVLILQSVRYSLDRELFDEHFRVAMTVFKGAHLVPLLYVTVAATSIVPFSLIKLHQTCARSRIQLLCNWCYVIYFCAFFVLIAVLQLSTDLSIAMKMVYYAVCIQVIAKLSHMTLECNRDRNAGRKLTAKHMAYFLLCPVLVFKFEYPRTKSRSYLRIARLFVEFWVTIAFSLCLIISFWRTTLSNYGTVPLTVSYVTQAMLYGVVVAPILFFAMHYALLHCWFVMWAEITQFADQR